MSLNGLAATPSTSAAPAAANTAVNWGLAASDTPIGAVAATAAAPATDTTTATTSDHAVAAIEGKMAELEVKTAVAPLDEEDPTVTVKVSGIRKDAGLGKLCSSRPTVVICIPYR